MKYAILFSCLFISTSVFANTINDISKSSPEYNAISQSIKRGYFNLHNNLHFNPQAPISRKEMALILQKLHQNQAKAPHLNTSNLQELSHLSKTYKHELSDVLSQVHSFNQSQKILNNDQTTLQNDFSHLENSLASEIVALKKERQWLWMGIGASLLLSIVSN